MSIDIQYIFKTILQLITFALSSITDLAILALRIVGTAVLTHPVDAGLPLGALDAAGADGQAGTALAHLRGETVGLGHALGLARAANVHVHEVVLVTVHFVANVHLVGARLL